MQTRNFKPPPIWRKLRRVDSHSTNARGDGASEVACTPFDEQSKAVYRLRFGKDYAQRGAPIASAIDARLNASL
jgi:phage-related protein